MSRPLPLNKLETWRSELGLMPVPLFGKQTDERRHVLLNGGKGNFCLDLAGEEGPGTASHGLERDWAWSSDVGHYVKVEPDMVVVWRWDQSSPERYKHRTISDNIVKFQTYLEERQPSRASSVVGHFMAIYRQVRSWKSRSKLSLVSTTMSLCSIRHAAQPSSCARRCDNCRWRDTVIV